MVYKMCMGLSHHHKTDGCFHDDYLPLPPVTLRHYWPSNQYAPRYVPVVILAVVRGTTFVDPFISGEGCLHHEAARRDSGWTGFLSNSSLLLDLEPAPQVKVFWC
ncbi:hypothetical protein AVEN_248637-1 [Araneus ventricosus]|uniref:Uncharacterized protein n=1 Tax=Araneus ventricosus TaxID=182803 RepID=A0A4Y2C0M5_ARAVE|nr:hypothetical protein AVEN_248637-1 [Araneus ventricosus]